MYARILVPVDASAAAAAGLKEAARVAQLCDAQLRLLHIVDDLHFAPEAALHPTTPAAGMSTALEAGSALLQRLRDDAIREAAVVESVLVESAGRPLHEIVNEQAQAWHAELLVLGTHGRRGVDRFVAGSVAEQVVRHADVPVLLVRAPQAGSQDGGLQSIAAAIA